jgi:hypothetical protein
VNQPDRSASSRGFGPCSVLFDPDIVSIGDIVDELLELVELYLVGSEP